MLDNTDYDASLGLGIEANTGDVITQLTYMFGGLENTPYGNGRIEVGSTAGECRFFKLSQFDKAAAYVVERTRRGEKTYVHCGLIKHDGEKVRLLNGTHSKGRDVLCWPVIWGEADQKHLDYDLTLKGKERNVARLKAFQMAAPWGMINATGIVPAIRLQGFIRLDEPAAPGDAMFWTVLKSYSVSGKLDTGANNSSQLMRLAGSVSFAGGDQKVVEIGESRRIDEAVKIVMHKPITVHPLDALHLHLQQDGRLVEVSAKGQLESAKSLEDLMTKVKRPDDAKNLNSEAVLAFVRKHVAEAGEVESGGDTNRRNAILAKAKTIGGLLWTGYFHPEEIVSNDEEFSLVEAYHENGGAADNGENGIAKGIIDAMATGAAKPLTSVGTEAVSGEAFGSVEEEGNQGDGDKADNTVKGALFEPVSFDGAFDLAASMPRRFIYRNWFALGYLTLIVAPGAAGKSALLRSMAICVAAGVDYLSGDRARLIKPRAVLVVNGEDDMADMQKGVEAFLREHEATKEERANVYRNLKMFSSVGADPTGKARFGIASYDNSGAVKISNVERKAIESFIDVSNIEVALFDPLASLHTTSESNEDLDVIARYFAGLATRKEIAVGLAHHTTKSSARAGKVDALDSRGGGATVNAARISVTINPLSAEEAAKLRIPADRQNRFIAVGLGSKVNIALANGPVLVLEKASHDADNARDGYASDSIVVLKRAGEVAAFAAGDEEDDEAADVPNLDDGIVQRLALEYESLETFLPEYLQVYSNCTSGTDIKRKGISSDVIRSEITFALDHYANRAKLASNAKPATVKKRTDQRRKQLNTALGKLEAGKRVRLVNVPGKGTVILLGG